MNRDLRSERRYFMITPLPAEIGGVNADVVDISTRGARLQVTEKIVLGRPTNFMLRTKEAAIETSASAVWCDVAAFSLHDEELDRYFCGITFERSVSLIGHIINDLVESHSAIPIEESRLSDRFRVIAPLTASFADEKGLRVLDLSIRGARLSTPSLIRPGTSGSLRFAINGSETHVWLPATVMWARSAQRKGRFEAGLRIADAEDWLKTVIDELALRDGVTIEIDSLQRKFDPFAAKPVSGLVGLRR
ncbi:MAG TPA: PilZ domain-containing protein [Thermoanaerobaculia bacterium]